MVNEIRQGPGSLLPTDIYATFLSSPFLFLFSFFISIQLVDSDVMSGISGAEKHGHTPVETASQQASVFLGSARVAFPKNKTQKQMSSSLSSFVLGRGADTPTGGEEGVLARFSPGQVFYRPDLYDLPRRSGPPSRRRTIPNFGLDGAGDGKPGNSEEGTLGFDQFEQIRDTIVPGSKRKMAESDLASLAQKRLNTVQSGKS